MIHTQFLYIVSVSKDRYINKVKNDLYHDSYDNEVGSDKTDFSMPYDTRGFFTLSVLICEDR